MRFIHHQAAKSLILFLAAVTLFAACVPPGPRALLQGKRLLEEGKYDEAVEKLRKAIVLLGNTNAQAFNYLGLACHQAGLVAEAKKSYQRALALNRDLTEAHYNLGCLLLSENQEEQAKTELTAYTLRKTTSADGWLKLGAAQLRLGLAGPAASRLTELSFAERSFYEALRLNPQNPETLNGLGVVKLRRNHINEATNLFSRALTEQHDYRPALLNLAIVAQQNLNDHQLALKHYRQYLSLKPAPEDAQAVQAIVNQLEAPPTPSIRAVVSNTIAAQTITNTTPAKTSLVENARTGVASMPAETNLARVAMSQKTEVTNVVVPKITVITNPPKVMPAPSPPPAATLETVQLPPEPVLTPAQDVPSNSSSETLAQLEPDKTPISASSSKAPKRTLFQRLNPLNLFGSDNKSASNPSHSSDPGQKEAMIITAVPESISKSFPRYTYVDPAKPEPGNRSEAEKVFAKGVQAQQAQHFTEAIQTYQRTIELDPSFYDAHYNLGLAASQAGNVPTALLAYETALALRPESLDARYNFALVLRQANYMVDAANELERIVAINPEEGRAHLALGNLYSQQFHDTARARQEYLKVLNTDPHIPQADAVRRWLTTHPR